MSGEVSLFDFGNSATLQPDRKITEQLTPTTKICKKSTKLVVAPTKEHSAPLNPPAIRNYKLVVQMVEAAFAKKLKTVLLLTSNGKEDRPATEWYLRRVIS